MNTQQPNKFAAIFHARQGSPDAAQAADVEPQAASKPVHQSAQLSVATSRPTAPATNTAAVTSRASGQGKSSDPRFKQVTAYIPQELHTNATIALRLANQTRIDAEKEDFSELLTRLLSKWYESQNYYKPNV